MDSLQILNTVGTAFAAHAADYAAIFLHFLSLSLLSVGGAIMLAPAMHQYLVDEREWLTDAQFSASISISQASPGPNILFVALMGWNVGANWAGMLAQNTALSGLGLAMAVGALGLAGACVAMLGIMIPSSTLTFFAGRWAYENRSLRVVQAFKQGMAPVVIALLAATGWVIISAQSQGDASAPSWLAVEQNWRLWLLAGVATLVVWRTNIHLLWVLGAGALAGGLGLV